jgi:hypothetical protein
MNPAEMLQAVLVPAAVVGVVLLALWGLGSAAARRTSDASAPAAAFSVCAGAMAGFVLSFGWNPKPVDSWKWILWLFPAAALLGSLSSRRDASTVTRLGYWTLLALAATGLVFRRVLLPSGGEFDLDRAALFVALPVALTALWSTVIPALGAGLGASALWLVASATALLCLCAHSLAFTQTAASVAGALGALVVACLLRPSASGLAGAVAPVAVLLSTLSLCAVVFARPYYSRSLFVLVALAPFGGLLPAGGRAWLRFLYIAVPVAVAGALALRTYDTGYG